MKKAKMKGVGFEAQAGKKSMKSLLSRGEPKPACVENARGRGKCLILCDHASNRVPASLGGLGLSSSRLKQHIAWDPGTEDIGRILSAALDAPAVFASYSRLVVDLNRGPNTPECILDCSDHVRIPGNRGLQRAERKRRLDEIFHPYHAEIDRQVNRFLSKDIVPLVISIHSFTPKMRGGKKRPWHMGILWNHEEDIAISLVRNLRAQNPRLHIGENEPYSLKQANLSKNTIGTHAEKRGLPYIIVEFRQDLVNTPEKAARWAGIFLKGISPLLEDPLLFRFRHHRHGKYS